MKNNRLDFTPKNSTNGLGQIDREYMMIEYKINERILISDCVEKKKD